MYKSKIRLTKSKSYSSNNDDNNLNISLEQTARLFNIDNTSDIIDGYQVFKNERDKCNKYRLILTINPYCTNILFNMCTEIHKDEDINSDSIITDDSRVSVLNAIGKNSNVNRSDMINNTEYSNDINNYVYYPGMDIFSNHILRNKTFRVVSKLNNNSDRNIFNTISDYMRYNDGTDIQTYNRVAGDTTNVPSPIKKHLYEMSNILRFDNGDAINNNLKVVNGWYGFYNGVKINCKKNVFSDLNVNKVINNKTAGEFIDMYPDRTLFSFNPKFNKFKNKLENNWDIALTYPYSNYYDNELIQKEWLIDGKNETINALLVFGMYMVKNSNGDDSVMFRTYTKHNLKRGDEFILYVDGKLLGRKYMVDEIGTISNDYLDNFFYINNTTLLDDIFEDDILQLFYDTVSYSSGDTIYLDYAPTEIPNKDMSKIGVAKKDSNGNFILVNNAKTYDYYKLKTNYLNILNVNLKRKEFRVAHIIGSTKSEYYIRKFRKIPNWRYSKNELTEEISKDPIKFNKFIKDNASVITGNGPNDYIMYDFNSERYKLGFANTIYNDDTTQYTFTDSIDIDKLYDNRGRDIHEIFMTVLKRNRGAKEWYNPNNRDYSNVECSHCFAPLSCGFDLLRINGDNNENCNNKMRTLSCVTLIDDTSIDSNPLKKDIKIEDNEFFGDLVEYNPIICNEIQLEKIYYRFNTYQREFGNTINNLRFNYNEIESDDYDKYNFKCVNYEVINNDYYKLYDIRFDINHRINKGGKYYDYVLFINKFTKKIKTYKWNGSKYIETPLIFGNVKERKEGYYYNPHYNIKLRELGDIKQDSHITARIKNASPIQIDGIYIKVEVNSKHNLKIGDKVYIFDDINNIKYETIVYSVENDYCFIINSIPYTRNGITWIKTCQKINDGTFKVRYNNKNIPYNAEKVDSNTYIWREILKVGDEKVKTLEEYPYTNNSFYIDKTFNFYLLRQDPFGNNGMQNNEIPFISDIKGRKLPKSKEYYKDPEIFAKC